MNGKPGEINHENKGRLLTNKRDTPFVLCFKYSLEKGYKLGDLEMRDVQDLHRFLEKIANMTVQQADSSFARKPDRNDTYKDSQVYHYAITDSFRVHVILEEGRYIIIRLDPKHAVHR